MLPAVPIGHSAVREDPAKTLLAGITAYCPQKTPANDP